MRDRVGRLQPRREARARSNALRPRHRRGPAQTPFAPAISARPRSSPPSQAGPSTSQASTSSAGQDEIEPGAAAGGGGGGAAAGLLAPAAGTPHVGCMCCTRVLGVDEACQLLYIVDMRRGEPRAAWCGHAQACKRRWTMRTMSQQRVGMRERRIGASRLSWLACCGLPLTRGSSGPLAPLHDASVDLFRQIERQRDPRARPPAARTCPDPDPPPLGLSARHAPPPVAGQAQPGGEHGQG